MALHKKIGGTLLKGLATVAGIQLATAIIVNTIATAHRRHRTPQGFPYREPTTCQVDHNAVTIYTYGAHLYDAMIEAIDAAEDHVYLESFIWKSDEVGQRFLDAVARASARGVRVACVWDVFANLVVPRSFFRFPSTVMTAPFGLVRGGLAWLLPRNSGRDHRKILVVDGAVCFVGGYNLGSLYANKWRDTHVRVEGPFALELEASFVDMWHVSDRHHRPLPYPRHRTWTSKLRLHRNVPRLAVYPIRGVYLDAINKASARIWLTHAYLLPDADLVQALIDAAGRGVDVSIIIPAASNHPLTDWLSRAHYDTLLSGGVKLFLYEGAMIHSKTATIDSIWSTVGTTNLDRVSMLGNYEVNVEFMDEAMARTLEDTFRTDLTNCHELTLDEWRRRPQYAQVAEAILKPLRPLL
jgi:cardiolipin synthase